MSIDAIILPYNLMDTDYRPGGTEVIHGLCTVKADRLGIHARRSYIVII
ncbi:MAG: hypothetical protein K0R55_1622 [Sporomusa sp.]|jgi:hypothetical protein|nr:hypothetical protein [Sporomusa sp.]